LAFFYIMKINPYNIWYPNWPTAGHNSLYYNRISYEAMRGISDPNAYRINSGAIREWVYPVAPPSCVVHLSHKAKTVV
jgi:hypothetical protein